MTSKESENEKDIMNKKLLSVVAGDSVPTIKIHDTDIFNAKNQPIRGYPCIVVP